MAVQVKGKVKQNWGLLTDDDLKRINGAVQEHEGRIQSRYGYEKEKAKREVDQFIKNL